MNAIGLDKKQAKALAEKLNDLLANYMVFYQNARGMHWNIKGKEFFELHLKFEELYTNLLLKIDEVAERILTLGATPLHTFTDFTSVSEIKSQKNVSKADVAINAILEAFEKIISKQRAILNSAAKANDEGTNALMSDYIREQEKLVWMYSSYQGK